MSGWVFMCAYGVTYSPRGTDSNFKRLAFIPRTVISKGFGTNL